MKRLLTHIGLALLLVVSFSSSAAAAGSAIAKAMNDLHWGMSENEVTLYLKSRLKKLYAEKIKKASASQKQQLKQEARSRFEAIKKSRVRFDGQRTQWDSGLIAYEFTHNNDESMLVAKDDNSTNFYFFINDSLWKWYKAFDRNAFKGKNFDRVSSGLQRRFGRGYSKETETVSGSGMRPVMEWRDRNTRLRAVDETAEHGRICLVFADASLVGQIASMRLNPDRRLAKLKAKKPSRRVVQEDSNQSYETVASKPSKPEAQPTKSNSRKSVFAHEAKSETDEEYEARKKRVLAKRADAERRKYERKKAAKRAKALEGLRGLEDSDPISGL